MSLHTRKIINMLTCFLQSIIFLFFVIGCGMGTIKFKKESSNTQETVETNPPKETTPTKPSTSSLLMSAGDSFTCSSRDNNDSKSSSTYCWGNNNFLQLGNTDAGQTKTQPYFVKELQNKIIGLSLGSSFGCALISGDNLKCWGRNDAFQLGNTSTQNQNSPSFVVDPYPEKAMMISSGSTHVCVLTESNTIQCWGQNNAGQLGLNIVAVGTNNTSFLPVTIPAGISGDSRVIDLKSSVNSNYILMADGNLGCWGSNASGGCAIGFGSSFQPFVWSTLPPGMLAKQVSILSSNVCILSQTNQVFCSGNNSQGVLGDNTTVSKVSFVASTVLNGTNVKSLLSSTQGAIVNCVITQSGGVRCFGDNRFGSIGSNIGNNGVILNPVDVLEISQAPLTSVEQIVTGGAISVLDTKCALKTDGTVWCWGSNNFGGLGNNGTTNSRFAQQTQLNEKAKSIYAGLYHFCAILVNEAVQCWGYNAFSTLGNNSTANGRVPQPVQGLQGAVTQIVGAETFTCALLKNGLVECWGANNLNQLGVSDTALVRRTASEVIPYYGGLSSSSQVSAGSSHTCVLMGGGFPKCFGNNSFGQLGIGTNVNTATPRYPSNLPRLVTQLALGENHTCFLGADRLVYCTGDNSFGQIGNGQTASTTTPVSANLSGAVSLASGKNHVCAILSDKSTWCWGNNLFGQLALGKVSRIQSVPLRITGLNETLIQITAGRGHTCGLSVTNKVYCWGLNLSGQLGTGDILNSSTPEPVKGLDNLKITEIVAGSEHTCAKTSDNQMYCWGENAGGQLGNSSFTKSNVPVIVPVP